MSEALNNAKARKDKLKALILQLHQGHAPELVRNELVRSLQSIPYNEVVEVEQELIQQGLPAEEVLRLCDIHGAVLDGTIDQQNAQPVPPGHPVDVFRQENLELMKVIHSTRALLDTLVGLEESEFKMHLLKIRTNFNALMDMDKHYKRKEYLLFPFMEKHGITGPPKVMWGKHDEIREQLNACLELLRAKELQKQDLADACELLLFPVLQALSDMTKKEEDILFPMAMDLLTEEDWWEIAKQTLEFGFSLYDPQTEWKPKHPSASDSRADGKLHENGTLQLPSGSFDAKEIQAILNSVPFDMTFVDKNDKVKYFTQGTERIFARSRSIINRDVRLCHPPGSVHIVEKIIDDFKTGRASHAPFWIQMQGKFIHIEYFALRDENGEYLGTLEVSQDLTKLRKLEGEQRILSYSDADSGSDSGSDSNSDKK